MIICIGILLFWLAIQCTLLSQVNQPTHTKFICTYIDACKLEGVKYVSKVSRNIRFFQQIYTSNLAHLSMNLSFSSSL